MINPKRVWHTVWQDLLPYDGRWAQAWRIALLCMFTTGVSMTYGIPEACISCYVLFFVMKSDAVESSLMAVALLVLVSIMVFVLIGLIQLSINSPPMRLILLVICSLLFMFLGVSSAVGPLGGILALVIAFVLTMLAYIPVGELATRAVLYAWLMTAMPMALLLIASLFIGRNPRKVLINEMATRLELAADLLERSATSLDKVRANLLTGIEDQQKRVQWIALLHLAPKFWQPWYGHAVVHSYGVLLAAYQWQQQGGAPSSTTQQLAQACKQAATQLRQQQRPDELDLPHITAEGPLQSLQQQLKDLMVSAPTTVLPKEKTSFFVDDAFTNPAYFRLAVQTTLAGVLCYLIYSAADWQGIHTALITCYIVGLSNTGETLHKMILRISGCLVGVLITFIYWFVFIPHMTSIGALMLAVFLVCLLAAWVVLGSERISYAGLQIAFAFLLINLSHMGPAVDMDMAWDRIMGILLGNLMMYVFFTYLWPYSIMHFIRKQMKQVQEALMKRDQAPTLTEATVYAATAARALDLAEYELELAPLEPKSIRATTEQLQQQRLELEQAQQCLFG